MLKPEEEEKLETIASCVATGIFIIIALALVGSVVGYISTYL